MCEGIGVELSKVVTWVDLVIHGTEVGAHVVTVLYTADSERKRTTYEDYTINVRILCLDSHDENGIYLMHGKNARRQRVCYMNCENAIYIVTIETFYAHSSILRHKIMAVTVKHNKNITYSLAGLILQTSAWSR